MFRQKKIVFLLLLIGLPRFPAKPLTTPGGLNEAVEENEADKQNDEYFIFRHSVNISKAVLSFPTPSTEFKEEMSRSLEDSEEDQTGGRQKRGLFIVGLIALAKYLAYTAVTTAVTAGTSAIVTVAVIHHMEDDDEVEDEDEDEVEDEDEDEDEDEVQQEDETKDERNQKKRKLGNAQVLKAVIFDNYLEKFDKHQEYEELSEPEKSKLRDLVFLAFFDENPTELENIEFNVVEQVSEAHLKLFLTENYVAENGLRGEYERMTEKGKSAFQAKVWRNFQHFSKKKVFF